MKILAIEKAVQGTTKNDFAPYLKVEAFTVWQLYQAGTLREIHFRQDEPGAVLFLECANVEQARDVLATLPLVRAGLIAFDIIPLVPYPGFSRLFAKED